VPARGQPRTASDFEESSDALDAPVVTRFGDAAHAAGDYRGRSGTRRTAMQIGSRRRVQILLASAAMAIVAAGPSIAQIPAPREQASPIKTQIDAADAVRSHIDRRFMEAVKNQKDGCAQYEQSITELEQMSTDKGVTVAVDSAFGQSDGKSVAFSRDFMESLQQYARSRLKEFKEICPPPGETQTAQRQESGTPSETDSAPLAPPGGLRARLGGPGGGMTSIDAPNGKTNMILVTGVDRGGEWISADFGRTRTYVGNQQTTFNNSYVELDDWDAPPKPDPKTGIDCRGGGCKSFLRKIVPFLQKQSRTASKSRQPTPENKRATEPTDDSDDLVDLLAQYLSGDLGAMGSTRIPNFPASATSTDPAAAGALAEDQTKLVKAVERWVIDAHVAAHEGVFDPDYAIYLIAKNVSDGGIAHISRTVLKKEVPLTADHRALINYIAYTRINDLRLSPPKRQAQPDKGQAATQATQTGNRTAGKEELRGLDQRDIENIKALPLEANGRAPLLILRTHREFFYIPGAQTCVQPGGKADDCPPEIGDETLDGAFIMITNPDFGGSSRCHDGSGKVDCPPDTLIVMKETWERYERLTSRQHARTHGQKAVEPSNASTKTGAAKGGGGLTSGDIDNIKNLPVEPLTTDQKKKSSKATAKHPPKTSTKKASSADTKKSTGKTATKSAPAQNNEAAEQIGQQIMQGLIQYGIGSALSSGNGRSNSHRGDGGRTTMNRSSGNKATSKTTTTAPAAGGGAGKSYLFQGFTVNPGR
jgi:hypothetical protein